MRLPWAQKARKHGGCKCVVTKQPRAPGDNGGVSMQISPGNHSPTCCASLATMRSWPWREKQQIAFHANRAHAYLRGRGRARARRRTRTGARMSTQAHASGVAPQSSDNAGHCLRMVVQQVVEPVDHKEHLCATYIAIASRTASPRDTCNRCCAICKKSWGHTPMTSTQTAGRPCARAREYDTREPWKRTADAP